MATSSTQATLDIKIGDFILVGSRRQGTSPQVVTGVSVAVSQTSGANVYTITTAQGTYAITPNTTVKEYSTQNGVATFVVG